MTKKQTPKIARSTNNLKGHHSKTRSNLLYKLYKHLDDHQV